MFNWFKTKKKKAAPPTGPVWKFDRIDYSEVENYSDGIQSIMAGQRIGFEIANFLTPEECDKLIAGFWEEEKKVSIVEGFQSYPRSFAQTEQLIHSGQMTARDYYLEAEAYRKNFPDNFGVDVESRIKKVIETLAPDKTVLCPAAPDGVGSFVPFNFRKLDPGPGRLKVHCGMFFYQEFPQLYDRFRHFTNNEHQISFFMMLQPAEQGGQLTVYDLTWDQAKKRPDDYTLLTLDGESIDIRDEKRLRRDTVHPQVGTLIVFYGGEIWHQVENVAGSHPRLTLGGFMSFSPDLSKLHYWT